MSSTHSMLLLLALVAGITAEKIPGFVVPGKCPVVDEVKLWTQQQPQLSKFGGTWYQHSLTKNPFQPLEECVQTHYDFDGEGFNAVTSGITSEGDQKVTEGEIYPMPLGDPHLMIDFDESFPAPLVILDTDYENYACLYSCMEFNSDYYTDFGFVFSRYQTLDDAYVRKCEAAFRHIGVDKTRFNMTPQGSQCSYD